MSKSVKKLVVVTGPTASGKTRAAIALAQHFHTEIVSADSRQLYKELNIGVARPTEAELKAAAHHFIASHSIFQPLDAAQYAREAHDLLHELFKQHDTVIVCGGSGLYLKALLEGFDDIPDIPEEIRLRIQDAYQRYGIGWLQEQMARHDADTLQHLDAKNPQRLMRALEVKLHTGKSIREFQQGKKLRLPWRVIKTGMDLPRSELYRRIDQRVLHMVEAGLFEEAERLHPYRHLTPLQTVGYEEIFDYMEGKHSREEAIHLIQRNTRRYAKRQLTWFRRDADILWIHPDKVEKMIEVIEG